MNIIQLSSNDINLVLSKFNFLFNLKYKNELEQSSNGSSTSASSFYNSNNTNSDNIEYILPNEKKISIDRNSCYYYTSSFHKKEKVFVIKSFYNDFLIFYQNITNKKYYIKSKKDFTEIMLKIPICRKISFLKFLKNLWVVLNLTNLTQDQKSSEILERFDLSLYNIAKKNNKIFNFELHQAVYDSNLRTISKILSNDNSGKNFYIYCDINEVDTNNNTPLLLALKLNNYDVVKVLCDHGAEIQLGSYDNAISPLEFALRNKMTKMLKILVNSRKTKTFSEWESNKEFVFDLIKKIPNFTMNLKLNFDSNLLNLFSSLTASDCYKISKLNGDMRIDMNVSSNNEFKGKNSILIKSNDQKIYKIDHIKKVSYDYIEQILSDKDEEKKVNKLLKEGIVHMKVYMDNLELLNNKITKEILGYKCNEYKVKGAMFVEKEIVKDVEERKDCEMINVNKSEKKTFEEYFYSKQRKLQKKKSCKSVQYKQSNNLDDNNDDNYDTFQTESNCDSKTKNKIKLNKKQLDMSVWLCNDFPLTLRHFLPLIHILSFASDDFSQLEHTISQKLLPFESFPLKISFPLGMSFHALLSIVSFTLENPPCNAFDINYLISDAKSNNITINENYLSTDNNFYNDYYKEKGSNSSNDSDEDNALQIREFPNIQTKKYEDCKSERYCQTFTSSVSSKIKKVPNNECDSLKPYKIPSAPFKRRKKRSSELERQNTIKCLVQLKLPKEIIKKYKAMNDERKKNESKAQTERSSVINKHKGGCCIF